MAYRQAAHPCNAWVPGASRLEPVETTGPPAAALAHWEAAHCFGSSLLDIPTRKTRHATPWD